MREIDDGKKTSSYEELIFSGIISHLSYSMISLKYGA